ncbi:MAG TPA: hypothetical protein PK867_06215 [Pirellulales bacterium]|nr:hypothetical protein [Pirellulales bacterium]
MGENPFGDLFAESEADRKAREARRKRAKQRRFLAAYASCGCINQAAREAKLSRECHYLWIARDAEYQADFRVAQENAFRFLRAKTELAADFVEQDAWRKAFQGEPRKKFTPKGRPVIDPATGKQYVEFEKSERLHIEILKKLDPAFRSSVSITQQVGVKIEQQIPADLAAMDATIPPPAEAMRRALATVALKQIEGGGTNGNGHANDGQNGHVPEQPDATA